MAGYDLLEQRFADGNGANGKGKDVYKRQIQSGPDHSGDREKQERQYAFFLYVHMAIRKSGSIGQDQNDHQDHDQVHACLLYTSRCV